MKFIGWGVVLTAIYFIDYTWFAWILAIWAIKTFILPIAVGLVKEEIKNQS